MYIKTERLELKPIAPDSLDALVELLTDDVVKQTYMVPDFPNREEAEKLAHRLITLSEQEERHVAGIYYGDSLIGILNETESVDDRIEVGYAILPRYHNQGFCTEALQGAIGYFFAQGINSASTQARMVYPSSRTSQSTAMCRTLHRRSHRLRNRRTCSDGVCISNNNLYPAALVEFQKVDVDLVLVVG